MNSVRCPKCKALLQMTIVATAVKEPTRNETEREILGILSDRADRIAYKALDGEWYFTNSTAAMPALEESILFAMLKSGALVHKYPDQSDGLCLPGQEYIK